MKNYLFWGVLLAILTVSVALAQDSDAVNSLLKNGETAVTVTDVQYQEDFSGKNDWTEDSEKDYNSEVTDDLYAMFTKGSIFIRGLDNQPQDNVVIEVQATQTSKGESSDYGIVCRANPDEFGSGYYFFIASNGYAAIFSNTVKDGLVTVVDWVETKAVNTGADSNALTAVCVDDYLALYVNGELVVEGQDSTYTDGVGGVSIGGFEDTDKVTVEFDNYTVWSAKAGKGGSSNGGSLGNLFGNGNNNNNNNNNSGSVGVIDNYDGDPADVIAQLDDQGFINTKRGEMLFTDESNDISGKEATFNEIDKTELHNLVVAGELTFEFGASPSDAFEECALTARNLPDNNGDPMAFTDAGFHNDETAEVVDVPSDGSDPVFHSATDTFDLTKPHHIIAIYIDDKVTFFVDGVMVLQDMPVEDRSGTVGLSMIGKTKSTSCSAANIWVYDLGN